MATGSHPEYPTYALLNAYQKYTVNGGSLFYLGGNGFYWVNTCCNNQPWRIEVRRGDSGCRAYDSPAGERFHSTTGELGGLWRQRGRAPNILFGVGSIACGLGRGPGYSIAEAGKDAKWAWIFDGIDLNQIIGDFGMGASGDEIDCVDYALGTPKNAVILASTTTHSDKFSIFPEEVRENMTKVSLNFAVTLTHE